MCSLLDGEWTTANMKSLSLILFPRRVVSPRKFDVSRPLCAASQVVPLEIVSMRETHGGLLWLLGETES